MELTRHSLRHPNWNYSEPGIYFVTTCIKDRAPLLGKVVGGDMQLSPAGEILRGIIQAQPSHYPNCRIDCLQIMPNHVHVTIQILDPLFVPSQTEIKWHGLGEIVRSIKSFSSRAINEMLGTAGVTRLQRSFYDHIIRDEHSLQRIREYMVNNPRQWELDRENLLATGPDPLFTFMEEQDRRPLPRTG